MAGEGGIAIEKPVKLWNRELQVKSFSELFQSLGKAALNGATLQWSNVGGDLLDASGAVGLTLDPGQKAWLLVYRALVQAVLRLLDSNQPLLVEEPREKEVSKKLKQALAVLDELELTIDERFFENPKQSPLLDAFRVPFAQWLEQYLESPKQAEAIAARLPSYFVFALHEEWRDRAQDYAEIKEQLDTPFTRAEGRERAWQRYRIWLQYQVEQPMFLEAFGLSSVYVEPNAYYVKRPQRSKNRYVDDESQVGERREQKRKRVAVRLMPTLKHWIREAERDSAIRVICGGPGCGKSSFTKILAAQLAEEMPDLPVLFIPLHQFDPEADLVEAVGHFIDSDPSNLLPPNPLSRDAREDKVLLIFDGLDELALQGKAGAEAAQQFVREVLKTLNRFNPERTPPTLLTLLSGRELVVQANQNEFRQEEQILHMLPYFLAKVDHNQYDDPQQLLEQDQRDDWWQNYGTATGKGYESGIPDALKLRNLDEITGQPLLNYLVALSYSRGKLSISETSNLNAIYRDLLNDIYERDWDPAGRHLSTQGLEQEDFEQILEEIALATWHGNGRTTTVSEIAKHCKDSELSELLNTFQTGAEQGVTRLLTAFYFRQSGQRDSEKTFEFTHKSFGEYLTARRIVWEIRNLHQELSRSKVFSGRGRRSGLTATAALEQWAKICGPTRIDPYLFQFICDEIRLVFEDDNFSETELVHKWQKTLISLMEVMMQQGMPMEKLALSTFWLMNEHAKNAEEALLAVLNACARCTQVLSTIQWPNNDFTTFGAWIARIQGQSINWANHMIWTSCLSWMDLSRCDIQGRNLEDVDLEGADLTQANLRGVNLTTAYLSKATLQQANLCDARLHETDLSEANLQKASLAGAVLCESCLMNANLEAANLEAADLRDACLEGANFAWADLSESHLEGSDLTKANFDCANLSDVTWDETTNLNRVKSWSRAKNLAESLKRKLQLDQAAASLSLDISKE